MAKQTLNNGETGLLFRTKLNDMFTELYVTNVTYAQLITLINASGLIPNSKYRITDYKTVHYILDSDLTVQTYGINSGSTEVLVVTAATANTLYSDCKSESYPQDIIVYDPIAANWTTDIAFTNLDTGIVVDGFKGVISYRFDTKQNVSLPYDFRQVKCRRWKHNLPEYSALTTYAKFKLVIHDGFLYISNVLGNINHTPSNGSIYWSQLIPIINEYFLTSPSGWSDLANNQDGGDIILAIENDFIDTLTFTSSDENSTYENSVRSLSFAPTYLSNNLGTFGTILLNNVFYLINSGLDIENVANSTFQTECINNTIVGLFYQNTIGTAFRNNIVQTSIGFNKNSIKVNCYNNIWGDTSSNEIGNSFHSNYIGVDFTMNVTHEDTFQNIFNVKCILNYFGIYSHFIITCPEFNSNSFLCSYNMRLWKDFSNGTFVKSKLYSKQISFFDTGSVEHIWLSYINDSGVQVIVNALT